MNVKSILKKHQSEIALVIGNGINIYGSAGETNSWHDLLVRLAEKYLPLGLKSVPAGVALTEFYDVLDLKSDRKESEISLQQEFCELMDSWNFYDHHKRIVDWAKALGRPILTTNFDKVLSDAGQCTLQRTKKSGFTDFYPWESYYGTEAIRNPIEGFGIWHVNGMQEYKRSIRLGLTHYMGSVERARNWIHKGNERRLFSGKNVQDWEGAASWLHVIFNSPLLIFGLSLEENEVFLRWLLIERARYFRKFPDRKKEAWYVYAGNSNSSGKQYFLEGVGITPLRVENYESIYGSETWI